VSESTLPPSSPATPADAPALRPEVVVYTTEICPYCAAAKNFLAARGVAWREVRVDGDIAARQWLRERTRLSTVPQIFIGDQAIGGYDDMIALHRAGKLEALLAGVAP
jgi:glutaredoxin 3